MPLFNYKCPHCGEEFEQLVRDPEERDRPRTCPACGKEGAGRLGRANISVGQGRPTGGGGGGGCGGCGQGGFT